jgi:hypothetical protein
MEHLIIPPMDHRWGERITVDLTVKIAARPFAVRAGRLRDLSVSGGAIQVSADIRLLTRVQVAIPVPNRFLDPIPVVSGYVTRKFGDCIGVEWSDFAPDAVRELLKAARAHRREIPAHPQTSALNLRDATVLESHMSAAPAKTISL